MNRTLKCLFFISLCCSLSIAFIIDYSQTKMITINDTGSYFGYSILLQKGNPPLAIVGAPRKRHSGKITGSLYNCNLNTLVCKEYNKISREYGIPSYNGSGDFLGSVLDGDGVAGSHFFTCASRFVTAHDSENHYTNGRCFSVKNSINLNENGQLILPLKSISQIAFDRSSAYYNAAFGESGLSLLYLKDQNEIITGAPGKALWNGALIRTKTRTLKSDVFSVQPNLANHHDNYYGYAVAWGRFNKGSSKISYVSGSPRANDLKGQIHFFEQNNYLKHTLLGEEYGSYFGSSLLVIHNKNGGDDILVGAPMYSGVSWDEGCVYYYKNKNDGTFHSPNKISTKKTESRFGTVIQDTGDIDLDSFSDCAISAPNEDDGIGAVYIYFGGREGFSNDRFHRISPSNFATVYPRIVVRGFGLGISKGNDMDNKKHNDIAIGAYKSGQIFYLKSYRMLDVETNVTSNVITLFTSTTNFTITYCLRFSFRNGEIWSQSFFTYLSLVDDRVVTEQNFTRTVTSQPGTFTCITYPVSLKKNHLNIEPFVVRYGYKLLNRSNDDLSEENTLNIPVSYECGSDNICQTNLTVKATVINITKIIIGLTQDLKVNVIVSNFGESAYQTKLYLNIPPDVSLINLRECDFTNGSYVCMVAQMLNGTIEKSFLFDLANIQSNRTNLPINIKVGSIGQDVDVLDNEQTLKIDTALQNNPYIDSKSTPDNVFLNKSKNFLEITHRFLVGNQGPSPLNLSLAIFVPQLAINDTQIIRINSAEGFINGIVNKCKYSNAGALITQNVTKINNTKIFSCLEPQIICKNIVCDAGYFSKSSDNAVFVLKLHIDVQSLAKFTENQNKLMITSFASFSNDTDEFSTSASTFIYGVSADATLPLWIYIASIVAGCALLLLVIFALHKCNFFKRSYKERLENEQSSANQLISEEEKSEEET